MRSEATATATVAADGGGGRRLSLVLLGLVFLAAYLPTMAWLVERWSMGVWYHSHGFLVPPLAAWLAAGALRRHRDQPPAASAWGFLFLVPAVALLALDAVLRFEIIAAVSLVLALPGLSLLLLGTRRTRAIRFPLAFLVFAIPIPLAVAHRVFLVLRTAAATGTGWGLRLVGFDVVREGTLIHYGRHSLVIADACSGFSTLLALVMFAALLAHGTLRRAPRVVALFALAVPIALLANVVRCLALALLVSVFGGGILDSWIHPGTGIAAFALALPLLVAVADLLGPPPEAHPS